MKEPGGRIKLINQGYPYESFIDETYKSILYPIPILLSFILKSYFWRVEYNWREARYGGGGWKHFSPFLKGSNHLKSVSVSVVVRTKHEAK